MRTAMLLSSFAALAACLDPTTGHRADGSDAAPDAAAVEALDDPLDPCLTPAAPLALIARDGGAFALGRCGALGYWKEREGRSLELLSGTHDLIASYPDPNGFAGTIAFSPSGRRIVATSVRSDLGFGDAVVGAFPSRAPFAIDGTFDFESSAELVFDAAERLYLLARADRGDAPAWVRIEGGVDLGPASVLARRAEHIFYALTKDPPSDSGADATLLHLNVASGTSTPLTELRRAWLEGSTMRTRQSFLVTGDGTRAVMTLECQAYDTTTCSGSRSAAFACTCQSIAERVLDSATGGALASDVWWRNPLVGAGPLVAADSEAGAVLLDARGAVVTLPDHRVAAVLADALMTTREGDLYVREADSDESTLVARDFVGLAVAAGGRSAAIRKGAGPDDVGGLVLWVDRRAVSVGGTKPFTDVAAVFDDGVTIAVAEDAVAILGPDGAARRTWPGGCVRQVTRRGVLVFFERCGAPNDMLYRFDLTTGREDVLAEGHDFLFEVDATGAHLAFTYVPLSGTSRELHAGRIAP